MASSFRVNFPLGCLRNYEKISSVPEWLDFKCVGPVRDWVARYDRGGGQVNLCWQNLESRSLTAVQNKMRMDSSNLSITIAKI